jgi:hypothetical protein
VYRVFEVKNSARIFLGAWKFNENNYQMMAFWVFFWSVFEKQHF